MKKVRRVQIFLLRSLLMIFQGISWPRNWQGVYRRTFNQCKKGIPISSNSMKCVSPVGCHHQKKIHPSPFVMDGHISSVAWDMKRIKIYHNLFSMVIIIPTGKKRCITPKTRKFKAGADIQQQSKTTKFTFSVAVSIIITRGRWERTLIRFWFMIRSSTNSAKSTQKDCTSIQERITSRL